MNTELPWLAGGTAPHGLLPTHSEGDQNGSRSPQPKQLAARWHLSEACLERWRSEGIGPKFMKLKGRVLYRQVDIEAYEESCWRRRPRHQRLKPVLADVPFRRQLLISADVLQHEGARGGRHGPHWKSAVHKRGLIKRVVQNQQPTVSPCGLFRTPAGSCGKNRTISGYGWGGTLRQTSVTQRLTAASNSCGKVRNPALKARNPTSSDCPLALTVCK